VTLDITTMTPVEVDTVLAHWYERDFDLRTWKMRSEVYRTEQRNLDRYSGVRAERNDEMIENYQTQIEELSAQAAPFQAEYERRGWNRYFLVANQNGHVHNGMKCSTCFFTTRYSWLVELAGATEVEMVTQFGEKACTICFPSAPTFPQYAIRLAQATSEADAIKREKKLSARARLVKKITNIEKRVQRYNDRLAKATEEWDRFYANYDLNGALTELGWATKDLARWDAKNPEYVEDSV